MSGRYALVIGNSRYDDPRLAQLSAPGKDAEDLARVLRERDYCAFDDVRVLLNEPEPAVREAIDEFFDEKAKDDLLVMYFSGHGVRDELGALYLAVRNTNRSRLRSSAIKSDFIQEAMEQSRARRQVLILDCCNSGAFQQGTKAATGGSIGIGNAFGGYGRVVLTASDSLQYAWQGDVVIGSTQNSLFTHFLVEGLKGEAEVNGDGIITVDELYDYAYEQVRRATPNQTPSKFSTRQEGEIVLRQIQRIDQIRAMPLPAPLVESLDNPLSAVRLGAVQELARLLKGKNLGLARSAQEALESLCAQDDSLSVRKAASEVLASIAPAEQASSANAVAAPSPRTKLESAAAAPAQVDKARLAQQRAEQDRLMREQAQRQRLAVEQARQERAAERKAQQAAADAEPRIAPRWLSVLWIVLGFVVTALLAAYISYSTVLTFALDGALSGLTIAGVLYLEKTLRQQTSIVWIVVAWAVPWAIRAAIYAAAGDAYANYPVIVTTLATAISMTLAGFALAYVLRREHALSQPASLLWVSAGWAFASALAAAAYLEMYQRIFWNTDISYFVPLALSAALHAGVGGAVMVWQIRTDGAAVVADTEPNRMGREPMASARGEPGPSPRWLAALWIALGFLVSSVLTQADNSNVVFNTALYGALVGLTVGLVLRLEHVVDQWKSIVWLVLGGAFGWAISGFYVESLLANGWSLEFVGWLILVEATSGGILGSALALVLGGERSLSPRNVLLWIVLAWVLAAAIDSLTVQMLYYWIFEPTGADVRIALALSSAIDGAIGGLATIWLLRRASTKAVAAQAES